MTSLSTVLPISMWTIPLRQNSCLAVHRKLTCRHCFSSCTSGPAQIMWRQTSWRARRWSSALLQNSPPPNTCLTLLLTTLSLWKEYSSSNFLASLSHTIWWWWWWWWWYDWQTHIDAIITIALFPQNPKKVRSQFTSTQTLLFIGYKTDSRILLCYLASRSDQGPGRVIGSHSTPGT